MWEIIAIIIVGVVFMAWATYMIFRHGHGYAAGPPPPKITLPQRDNNLPIFKNPPPPPPRPKQQTEDNSFTDSFIIGMVTDNAIIGGAMGGSMLGGMMGDMLNDGDLF